MKCSLAQNDCWNISVKRELEQSKRHLVIGSTESLSRIQQLIDGCVAVCRMVPEEKLLEVEIEPGMRDGQIYPFVAEGKIDLDKNTLRTGISQTERTH